MLSKLIFPSPPRRWAGALALLGLVAGPALAQRTPVLRNLADVKKLSGTLVAQGRTAPETPLRITGYRIALVALPEPTLVAIQGKDVEVTEAWHVTVDFAAPLTVRNQAFSLVIDGRWCGLLQEGVDLLSADTVCFDGSLIHDGAALGVTYRSIQIVTSPADERRLAPNVVFPDAGDAVHYSSARVRLGGTQ